MTQGMTNPKVFGSGALRTRAHPTDGVRRQHSVLCRTKVGQFWGSGFLKITRRGRRKKGGSDENGFPLSYSLPCE